MKDLVCIGELLIDMVSPEPDLSLKECFTLKKAPGGAPANVCAGAAKLGLEVGFIGKVGADSFGTFLQETLAAHRVDTSQLFLEAKARTTIAFVATRKDGNKDILFYRNPGADMLLRPEEISAGFLQESKLLYFGSLSLSQSPCREAVLKAVSLAKQNNIPVFYDPNLRTAVWNSLDEAQKWIRAGMEYADVVKLAEEEWQFITGTTSLEEGSQLLLAAGPRLVIVSRGAAGCYYDNGQIRGYLPAVKVQAIDPLGAGDAFVAAVIYWLIKKDYIHQLEEISEADMQVVLQFANGAGAYTTQQIGAINAMPNLAELEAFLRSRG